MESFGSSQIDFVCNICGEKNSAPAHHFHREIPNCQACKSTPRFRGTLKALSVALFGRSLVLDEFPFDKSIRGIGMSDWERTAEVLTDRLDYTNTYFHDEPFLDITAGFSSKFAGLDFILCTEVLEHVLGSIDVPLRNMRKMLRPGGTLILTTPFTSDATTSEHFPDMVGFDLIEQNGHWTVVSKRRDGSTQRYTEGVHFHGGPGTVLEMRLFGEQSLLSAVERAGFKAQVHSEADPTIGYYWPLTQDRAGFGTGLHYVISASLRRRLSVASIFRSRRRR